MIGQMDVIQGWMDDIEEWLDECRTVKRMDGC